MDDPENRLIAEIYDISRSAANKQINLTIEKLMEYEEKLKLKADEITQKENDIKEIKKAIDSSEYNEENYPEYKELYGRSIGYVLSKDYWGKGLMPEAVKAVIQKNVEKTFNTFA